ncbi:hypothetical protein HYDPIDRAFT_114247 [Hydnomerulius pinastri MD-312]|uniref:Mitochondrial K+-H+ exchange-related-domain-containing protein n=1 Tax=Hydnomerulius pinastri MD-312 TaxID=994086 RepID=A0A0C9WD03_9AGAM|nr:hypothetical protein HYDPIDRAFT_114247 [Hydnomerulius pinastri MD-312]
MSLLPKATRSMRIIALPLAKARNPPDSKLKPNAVFNTNRMLIYYHFNILTPHGTVDDHSWAKILLKKVSTKAADIWANFGKAPEGSWKLRTYEYGERIVDRIDFEELALKGVDPSLGPSFIQPDVAGKTTEEISKDSDRVFSKLSKVHLIYPPSLYTGPLSGGPNGGLHPSIAHLRELLTSREPRHRRGFFLWAIIAPFTAPFMLIPVIPNLPFFFCVWRSWSHYRAYRSSQYLSSLLDHGLIVPDPSPELDKLYTSFTPSPHVSQNLPLSTTPSSSSSEERSKSENTTSASNKQSQSAFTSGPSPSSGDSVRPPQRLLLTRKAIPNILELFHLPESAAADMYRAVEQVRGRLGGGSSRV